MIAGKFELSSLIRRVTTHTHNDRESIYTPAVNTIIANRAAEHPRLKAADPNYDRTEVYFNKHGYTQDQYRSMTQYYIGNACIGAKTLCTYTVVVVHLLVVITHLTLGRAYEFVMCDWADVLLEPLDRALEGPTPVSSIVFKVRPKQLGGGESFYFAMPNVNPFSCVFWALGLVLFT